MQAIASAVEEQDVATKEISHSIAVASDGSATATSNVDTVAGAIKATSTEAGRVMGVSDELAEVASALSLAVDEFLEGVSADVRDRREQMRIRVDQEVVLLAAGRRVPVTLIDISESGAKLSPVDDLRIGDHVQIEWDESVTELAGRRLRAERRGRRQRRQTIDVDSLPIEVHLCTIAAACERSPLANFNIANSKSHLGARRLDQSAHARVTHTRS